MEDRFFAYAFIFSFVYSFVHTLFISHKIRFWSLERGDGIIEGFKQWHYAKDTGFKKVWEFLLILFSFFMLTMYKFMFLCFISTFIVLFLTGSFTFQQ